jgi:Fe-S-cluster containining protein
VQPDDDTAAAFDCRECGACCHDASDGRVLVSAEDLVRWRRDARGDILSQLVPGHFSQQGFAADASGCCVHLGTPGHANDCSIYPTRGQACRDLEPGSRQCLDYRRSYGIVDPPA